MVEVALWHNNEYRTKNNI